MKKLYKSQIVCLLCLLFSLIFNSQNIFASDNKNLSNFIDFTISYNDIGQKVEGAEFSFYKIGEIDSNKKIILTNDFKLYPIDLNNLNVIQWNEYAITLKGYVKRDNIRPIYKAKTDINGNINAKLEKGIYLLVGEDLYAGENIYKTNPFIISLPEFDNESNAYIYKSMSYPKFKRNNIPKTYIDVDVLKVWDDEDFISERPEFVEVELLEDGKVVDTVKLSKKNNWSYNWKNLNPKSSWLVVEKNINKDKYFVKVKNYGNSFTITNVKVPPRTLTGKVPKEDFKIPPKKIPKKPPKKLTKIPQTGQLWWPVYLLSGIGTVSILFGFIKEKGGKE